ncbi:hypothetical protein EJD97_017530, partial [Solanum chilense]
TVRRWHRSGAAEGRWGSLTKCGVMESVTDRRSHDGPSCWFIMNIREIVPVPKFEEFMCFGKETPTDFCAYDDPSYLPSRVMKRATEEIVQVWDDGVHDGPS